MKELSRQQIFDRAVLGVVRQGALSLDPKIGCVYRSKVEGRTLACGVGQLIDDDLYSGEFEDIRVADVVACGESLFHERAEKLALALAFSGVNVVDHRVVELLTLIQSAHDKADGLASFVERAKHVAARQGLEFPTLPSWVSN